MTPSAVLELAPDLDDDGPGLPLGPPPPEVLELDDVPCGLCDGDGDVVNPDNADPSVALCDWLPPVICPRCRGRGRDPNPGPSDPDGTL